MYWGRFTEHGRTFDSAAGILEARVTGSKIETGLSSWPESIKENWLLVDKSFVLPRVIENGNPIIVTRPRRSGKTMFLSMSEDFFEVPRGETLDEKKARYRDMKIGDIPGFIDEHCGRRLPEIDKKVKESNKVLSALKAEFDEKSKLMKTDITSCTGILKSLVQFLNAYHGRACILLIDEFDAPILDASKDNRDTIKCHIRDMLSPVVKPGIERLLSKCIMVGVKAINPTELGFGLDNFTALPLHYASQEPYTDNLLELGNMPYQVAFGFTEDEVRKLIATH
ncbi:hypothetical protein EV182_005536, partial [Spiromyces aspiralis]